jgi:hypothetical protein
MFLRLTCSQQRNLTGTPQALSHVSSHDETHITGPRLLPSRFTNGLQPYAKHAVDTRRTISVHMLNAVTQKAGIAIPRPSDLASCLVQSRDL